MQTPTVPNIFDRWQQAWAIPGFSRRLVFFLLIFIGILIAFPYFFSFIEIRRGYQITDPLLDVLPAHDFSPITFTIIWLVSLWFMIRMIQQPSIALLGIVAIDLIFLTRMVTIVLLPLEPPPGLLELKDPISNYFYGEEHAFITRDLFFSGHTSTQIMIGLVLPGKREKFMAFFGAAVVGILVLVQHIHYTIDVVGALIFTWILYKLARAIVADVSFDQKASPN
ncbi:MAG: phosphatase PAP2-related protein [Bacteroidota bacterium]